MLCYMEYEPSTIIKNECTVQSLAPRSPLNWKAGFGLLESTACAHLQTGNIVSAGREICKREIESGARAALMYAAVVPTSCRGTQRVVFPALTSDSRLRSLKTQFRFSHSDLIFTTRR